jgi:hypothetical protein
MLSAWIAYDALCQQYGNGTYALDAHPLFTEMLNRSWSVPEEMSTDDTINRSLRKVILATFPHMFPATLTIPMETLVDELTTTHLRTILERAHKLVRGITCINATNYFRVFSAPVGSTPPVMSIYHQTGGISMGTAMAPPVANLWLAALEFASPWMRKAHTAMPTCTHSLTYGRFIDDGLAIVLMDKPTTASIEAMRLELQTRFNTLHPSMKWTVETGGKDGTPYLDLLLQPTIDGATHRLSFAPYTKPIDNHLMMSPLSNHPFSTYKGAWIGSAFRIARNSTSQEVYTQAMSQYYAILEARGFKSDKIKHLINDRVDWNTIQRRTANGQLYRLNSALADVGPTAEFNGFQQKSWRLCITYSPAINKDLLIRAIRGAVEGHYAETDTLDTPAEVLHRAISNNVPAIIWRGFTNTGTQIDSTQIRMRSLETDAYMYEHVSTIQPVDTMLPISEMVHSVNTAAHLTPTLTRSLCATLQ